MIFKVIIFILFLNFAFAEEKSLSCSKGGLEIIYVNGIYNSEEETENSSEAVDVLVQRDKERFDVKSVNVTHSYNRSEGFIRDVIQLLSQKLAQDKATASRASYLIPLFFFLRSEFVKQVPQNIVNEILDEQMKLIAEQAYHSQVDKFALAQKVKQSLDSNKKVILISHSQGNLYVNAAYNILRQQIPQDRLDKFVGNLQVGSVAHGSNYKNSRIYSHKQDLALLAYEYKTGLRIAPKQYSADLSCVFKIGCHDFINAYLSPNIMNNGPKQGKGVETRIAERTFLDSLEEVAWMLANNDEDCCDGRDGRFYRKDYDSEPQKGFLEDTVALDENVELEIDETSQICGKVNINHTVDGGKIKFENTKVEAEALVTISGNVYLTDNTNIYSFENSGPISITGTHPSIPLYMERTSIAGNPQISGALIMSDVTISEGGNISGEVFEPTGSVPSITDSYLSNNSNFSGHYYVSRDINRTTIEGIAIIRPDNGQFGTLGIGPFPQDIQGGHIKGLVNIQGQMDVDITMNGYGVGNNYGGIIINPGAIVLSHVTITGGAVMSPTAVFSGTWHASNTDPNGYLGHLYYSEVYNSSMSGAPNVNGSILHQVTISGSPYISGCQQTGCSYSCNAQVVGESGSCGPYGCGYVTGASKLADYLEEAKAMNESLRRADRFTQSFVEWNKNKVAEILEKF